MKIDQQDRLQITLQSASGQLKNVSDQFLVLFKREDFSVEFYVPDGADTQQPHEQDEVYIVASGSGVFLRGEDRVNFATGDFLFVPAGVIHRFEQFTSDFQTWVIFFGPMGGYGG